MEHPLHQSLQMGQRPRQNSVFVGSSFSLLPNDQSTPRRAKSAFDLQSLVLAECTVQNNHENMNIRTEENENDEEDTIDERETEFLAFTLAHSSSNRRLKPFNEYPKASRSFQRERGASMCHFDRTDVIARPLQRERGMSICHFDRMDVLARPLQPRDRGSSICHFDRMDVLARPSCYKGSRSSITGNVDKLDNLGKSFQRDSRTSIIFNGSIDKSQICGLENFQRFPNTSRPRDSRNNVPTLDRPENMARFLQRDSRASLGNNERPIIVENLAKNGSAGQSVGNIGASGTRDHRTNSLSPYDRPSCSKTPDVVLGYEATCVWFISLIFSSLILHPHIHTMRSSQNPSLLFHRSFISRKITTEIRIVPSLSKYWLQHFSKCLRVPVYRCNYHSQFEPKQYSANICLQKKQEIGSSSAFHFYFSLLFIPYR